MKTLYTNLMCTGYELEFTKKLEFTGITELLLQRALVRLENNVDSDRGWYSCFHRLNVLDLILFPLLAL